MMGLYYRCSKFLSFCTGQLQKGLLGHTKKVWIPTRVIANRSDHEYCVWQKRYYGQYRIGGRQKFDILSSTFDKSKNYNFDNYTYYCAHGRSKKRIQTKKH